MSGFPNYVAQTTAATAKDMRKVMKVGMARLAGNSADGKRVSETVRAKLGG